MREAMYVMLLVVFYTGEAALGIGLRHSQTTENSEMDTTTLTSATIRLTNGTTLRIAPVTTLLYNLHRNVSLASTHRRKLGDFRECSPCTCCDSSRRWCLPTVCCYHINCGVRDLPFGLCSFTPISCSCLGCRD
ncbi:uncharacterized protein [Physcomitrium patens]|uniref:DUF7866 domain-containing protein n=1 Tax=Physcomitrium patens TaxID=3218 RepID=A0A2K1KG72_PHYPA|nr:uncharacterized protein LOC112283531 [Physcomitrium patens]PNR52771.1 hypothetical protein PHYPA_009146 [Physcomitrium patens]|eukprot:XP_024378107.1 uncharacterized protein LOC112283531 [Physcomitrella patens]